MKEKKKEGGNEADCMKTGERKSESGKKKCIKQNGGKRKWKIK